MGILRDNVVGEIQVYENLKKKEGKKKHQRYW